MVDFLVNPLDQYVLDDVYPAWLPAADWRRQSLTIFCVLNVGAVLLYFCVGGLMYHFAFDQDLRNHPKFLKDQERTEIYYALRAIPWIAVYSTPIFVLELRGYSKLYDNVDGDWAYLVKSILGFVVWNDFWVYLVHRALHLPFFYKHIHKTHHLFKVPTPFASLAFEPIDGYSQSVPYHLFVFLFPMHKLTYIVSFVMIQVWTVSIHDQWFIVPASLEPYLNGSAHHSDHHMYFNYNHGLYFTLCDRVFGTHRIPSAAEGNGPADDLARLRKQGKVPPPKGADHVKAA